MKVWYIRTWGAGTPIYVVSALSKEEAWKMVEEAWKKRYGNCPYRVGGHASIDSSGARKYVYQTIDDLVEIEGLVAETSVIRDVCE